MALMGSLKLLCNLGKILKTHVKAWGGKQPRKGRCHDPWEKAVNEMSSAFTSDYYLRLLVILSQGGRAWAESITLLYRMDMAFGAAGEEDLREVSPQICRQILFAWSYQMIPQLHQRGVGFQDAQSSGTAEKLKGWAKVSATEGDRGCSSSLAKVEGPW